MATGFMDAIKKNGSSSVASVLVAFAVLPFHDAGAADITVSALFNGKAVVVIDGGKPRTLSVGQVSPEGVKLLAASSESAVFELNGQRQTLTTGQGTRIGAAAPTGGSGQTTLIADSRGHFITTGSVNGVSVQFMVDTGASSVAMSMAEARRLGINYLAGQRGLVSTANGVIPMYRVKLDNVRVGDITLNNVDGVVLEGAGLGNYSLLGMSFLNRTQMNRDGDRLTLTRRY
jgi:aspartyl protease family protein